METEKARWFRGNWLSSAPRGLVVAVALLLNVACGSRVRDAVGGETGFLGACGTDTDCKLGLCACGVCTRTCVTADDCDDGRALCVTEVNENECAEGHHVCIPQTDPNPTSSPGTPAENCRGPGHYEAGKEGSYLPCCDGLAEVAQLSAGYDDNNNPICAQLPLNVYACVEGGCGDAVCEIGEDVPCGCAEDCPGAVWEVEAVPAASTSGDTSSESSGSCEGSVCELPLNPFSSGRVKIEIEFEGVFCSPQCDSPAPPAITIYHVPTGLVVPVGGRSTCDLCPGPPTGDCASSTLSPVDWDGAIKRNDSTCINESFPEEMACQREVRYAPSGRYRAELCSLAATWNETFQTMRCGFTFDQSTLRCESVEFDYPTLEPVVIRFDNSRQSDVDSGFDEVMDAGVDASAE